MSTGSSKTYISRPAPGFVLEEKFDIALNNLQNKELNMNRAYYDDSITNFLNISPEPAFEPMH